MNPELVFSIINALPMPIWLTWVLAPKSKLARYFADPQAFVAADPRLRAHGETHSQTMPAYDNLTLEQRRVLAAWLLEG